MFGFPTQLKYTLAPLCFFAVIIAFEILKPASSELLGFYPDKILEGEVWRLVTGQMMHTNFNHMLLNLAGLTLVWALHGEYYQAKHYAYLVLASLLSVGLGLILFADYQNYAGLSGIIHTMLIYGSCIDLLNKDKTGWLIIIGLFVKVAYENLIGASEATKALIEANVAVEAHLIGLICGLILVSIYHLDRNKKKVLGK